MIQARVEARSGSASKPTPPPPDHRTTPTPHVGSFTPTPIVDVTADAMAGRSRTVTPHETDVAEQLAPAQHADLDLGDEISPDLNPSELEMNPDAAAMSTEPDEEPVPVWTHVEEQAPETKDPTLVVWVNDDQE